jgi:hypothetical protein
MQLDGATTACRSINLDGALVARETAHFGSAGRPAVGVRLPDRQLRPPPGSEPDDTPSPTSVRATARGGMMT